MKIKTSFDSPHQSPELSESTAQQREHERSQVVDLTVGGGGTVYTLTPQTQLGRDWLNVSVGTDAQYLGSALVVEHRYIADIVDGARADGLVVR